MGQIQPYHGTTDTGTPYIDATGLEHAEALGSTLVDVERQIANWVTATQGRTKSSLFDRQSYVPPDNPFTLMRTARGAVENDDIVGGVADVTEGLMLQGIKWESEDPDTADVFNQIARDLNLDQLARQWHREEFTYSQVVCGLWWGRKSYTVRGKTKSGNRKRKKYDLQVPLAMSFLDPMRVIPLPPGPFGFDRLAWQASEAELGQFVAYEMTGDITYMDATMRRFLLRRLEFSRAEKQTLESWGVDTRRLIELNPENVFRYTRTKPTYQRWADLRLKSVFPLLDLKQQLLEADRVSLVGAANYILLIRKGTKDDPASQEELDNLNTQFKVIAKLPVIVGDHRLEISIITPDQESTLKSDRYDTLDQRILARSLGALLLGSGTGSSSQKTTGDMTSRGVARALENRRHMMKRVFEERVARAVVEHPENASQFDDEPNLTFTPRNVQLDSDAQITQAIMALRTQKELSRESTLEYFGFDQATEAQRREYEEESGLDDIFKTEVPFSGSGQGPNGAPEAPAVSGARGGRPAGGGTSKQSPQAQTKPKTGNGNPSTGQ